jgi:hypothetical protein
MIHCRRGRCLEIFEITRLSKPIPSASLESKSSTKMPPFCVSVLRSSNSWARRRRGFHDTDALNLAKRRLCDAVGISFGSAAHCCAISVRPSSGGAHCCYPPLKPPLAPTHQFRRTKKLLLVIIFMIRPPTVATLTQ